MTNSVTGYLLSRHWRDTDQGVELCFWGASDNGPVRIQIPRQEAVCFINRNTPLSVSNRVRREQRKLKSLDGRDADALYFKHQRDLTSLRQQTNELYESDVKPGDRYLMERFICAGFEAEGEVQQKKGYRSIISPRLKPAKVEPSLKALSVDIETRGSSDQLYSIAGAVMSGSDSTNRVFMIGDGEPPLTNGFKLHYFANERALLLAFFEWLRLIDPDIIVGWAIVGFDLNFI